MVCSGELMFAELGVTTNFSFLRGASHPEELVGMAGGFGLAGLGIADRNSLAGVVRAHVFARDKLNKEGNPIRVVVGTRLVFCDGTPDILVYPTDRDAYGRLTRLLTRGNRRAEKGSCILRLGDLLDFIDGLQLIVMDRSTAEDDHQPAPEGAAVGGDKPARTARTSAPPNRTASMGQKAGRRSASACIGPTFTPEPADRNEPSPQSAGFLLLPFTGEGGLAKRGRMRGVRRSKVPSSSRLRRATFSRMAGEGLRS